VGNRQGQPARRAHRVAQVPTQLARRFHPDRFAEMSCPHIFPGQPTVSADSDPTGPWGPGPWGQTDLLVITEAALSLESHEVPTGIVLTLEPGGKPSGEIGHALGT